MRYPYSMLMFLVLTGCPQSTPLEEEEKDLATEVAELKSAQQETRNLVDAHDGEISSLVRLGETTQGLAIDNARKIRNQEGEVSRVESDFRDHREEFNAFKRTTGEDIGSLKREAEEDRQEVRDATQRLDEVLSRIDERRDEKSGRDLSTDRFGIITSPDPAGWYVKDRHAPSERFKRFFQYRTGEVMVWISLASLPRGGCWVDGERRGDHIHIQHIPFELRHMDLPEKIPVPPFPVP